MYISYIVVFIIFIFFFQFSGIEYLCENHLLRMDAQDIAHFLYKGEGLNKTAIGKANQSLNCLFFFLLSLALDQKYSINTYTTVYQSFNLKQAGQQQKCQRQRKIFCTIHQ